MGPNCFQSTFTSDIRVQMEKDLVLALVRSAIALLRARCGGRFKVIPDSVIPNPQSR